MLTKPKEHNTGNGKPPKEEKASFNKVQNQTLSTTDKEIIPRMTSDGLSQGQRHTQFFLLGRLFNNSCIKPTAALTEHYLLTNCISIMRTATACHYYYYICSEAPAHQVGPVVFEQPQTAYVCVCKRESN